jgi:putative oxidoreductase
MGTSISGHVSNERMLHFTLWGAQILLASFFAAMAWLKLALHSERLIEIMAWAAVLPMPLVRALGVAELIGAIVVAAPAVTRAPQRMVGWAATGFMALMVAAATIHIARGELRMLPINLTVFALAAFVAWGRLAHQPIETLEA